jgi:hypothetical protein
LRTDHQLWRGVAKGRVIVDRFAHVAVRVRALRLARATTDERTRVALEEHYRDVKARVEALAASKKSNPFPK